MCMPQAFTDHYQQAKTSCAKKQRQVLSSKSNRVQANTQVCKNDVLVQAQSAERFSMRAGRK